MAKLSSLASVLRSKNAGPLLLTLDIMFDEEVPYDQVRNSGVISKQLISRLYKVSEEEVQIFEYDPAFAIKITIPRRYPVGDERDSDIYGAQQHAPLLDIEVPESP